MKLATLGASLEALLADFAAELTAAGASVPAVQYVGAGQIPWDAESLTVYLGDIAQGQPGMPTAQSFTSATPINLSATVHVQILRAVSVTEDGIGTINIPPMSAMNADGVQAMNDAGALLQAAIAIFAKYEVTSPGEGFVITSLTPMGPEGGLASVQLTLSVSLS